MPRNPHDDYQTPQPLADEIVRRVAELVPLGNPVILEPGAGAGNFVRAARARWPKAHIVAIDVRDTRPLCCAEGASEARIGDVLAVDLPTCDLAIGNPPFGLAQEFIERVLSAAVHARGGHLAFLLRMSMLCTQERSRTLWAKPGLRHLIPLAARPSFTGGGSDNSEYGVFVWQRGFTGRPTIEPHLWIGGSSPS